MDKILKSLNKEEKDAIEELRLRFRSSLTPMLDKDSSLHYRFLKARDFDVNKADAMLRKHILWRKAHQVDDILQTFKPKEVFRFMNAPIVGFDKEGNIVRYGPAGHLDIRDLIGAFALHDYFKHWIWQGELDRQILKQNGRGAFQVIMIVDLADCPFSNVTHKSTLEFILQGSTLLQDNYPERIKRIYIINAPVFVTILVNMLKTVMSAAMIRKFQVYSQSGWKEALLEIIDADVLPAFLGGNRTDPDGNSLCNTIVHHGGRIDPKFFLEKAERYFKDVSQVHKAQIPPKETFEVLIEVNDSDSVIQWEFLSKNKDIEFGLFYQTNEFELEELLPMFKYATYDGTEKRSFKVQATGTYIIRFSNSLSWWSSKEVHYCVTVSQLGQV